MKKKDKTLFLKFMLIILLFLALFHMPYGFYELLRFVAMSFFIYFAIICYRYKKENQMLIYIFLALLFQPFHKIALGRFIWNLVDIFVAIYLFNSLIKKKKC